MGSERGTGRAMRCGLVLVVLALAGGVAACAGGSGGDASRGAAAADSSRGPVKTSGTAAPAGAAAVAPPAASAPRVLFLGTSLTAGLGLDPDSAYPQRIQRKIAAAGLPYEVVNAGVSGETSAGLERRLDWVLAQPAKVIVVETGANDGLRGLDVAATRATIGAVLDRIKRERPEATVALVQMEAPPNLGAQYTTAFHAMFPALAREHGVVLLPFLLDGVAGHPSLNQADGIHPNDVGERLVADNLWRALEGLLRGGGSSKGVNGAG